MGGAAPPSPGGRPLLPLAGLLVGVWAVLPPYSGPEINTATSVEVADHVIPAVVLLGVSAWALVRSRRPRPAGQAPGSGLLVAGMAIVLAGLWMTATHVPLVNQARNDQVGTAAAAYHTIPGLVVLGLGARWVARHWADAEPDGAAGGRRPEVEEVEEV